MTPLLQITTLLLIPFSLFILTFLVHNFLARLRYTLPPGPKPWPVVGNIYDLKPVKFRCFHEWAQTYGPILSYWLGSKLYIVVSSVELAKQVLKEHGQILGDRHRSSSATMFSKNGMDLIWADYGPHHVKIKKACTLELFTQKRLEALRPIREDEITTMIESLFVDCSNPDIVPSDFYRLCYYAYCILLTENKGKPLIARRYIWVVCFNNISRLTFGKRLMNSKGELDPLGKEFKRILSSGVKSTKTRLLAEHLPWLRWLLAPLDKEKHEAAVSNARMDQFTREIVEEHAKAKSNNVNIVKQHFLDALLSLKDQYDFSEDTMISLLWDMVIAGTDTVVIAVEWALVELIRNPRVKKKAQEELDQVIGQNRIMTEEDFSSLPYLQALVKESLRLHPSAPLLLPHKAKAHVKVGGYDIPKGAIVHVNVWALGHDPNVWQEPNEFRPERFFEEDINMKGHDFRLLPFGAGRRICPGAQLGINLATSMLGHLLHHFDWNPPNGVKPTDIDMTENPGVVTYMTTPLQAVANPRLPEELYKRVAIEI